MKNKQNQIIKIKNHFEKWFFILKYIVIILISFLSWNYFGLLFLTNIYLLFHFIETDTSNFGIYLIKCYSFILAWHIGAIGWLINVDNGIAALLANSIIYTTPLAIIYFIPKNKKILLLIPIWLTFEILVNTISFSTPLLTIGNTFSTQVSLIQWYKYSSVIGGSFWFLLITFLLYKRKYSYFTILLIIPSIFSLFLYNVNLKTYNGTLKITIFNSSFLSNKKVLERNKALYILNKLNHYQNSDLLLLPESTITFNSKFYKNTINYKILNEMVTNQKIKNILFGANIKVDKIKRINTGIFLTKNKTYIKVKKKLVPYTESIPKLINYFYKKDNFSYNFKDNSNEIVKKYHFTPLICYESFFPFFVSKKSIKSKLIIVISSEQFMKKTNYGKMQYNNILKLRAIENSLPLIKCSDGGNSILINEHGVTIDESNFEEFHTFKINNLYF